MRTPTEPKGLVLRTKVLRVSRLNQSFGILREPNGRTMKARNLAAKDKSGTSDPVSAHDKQECGLG